MTGPSEGGGSFDYTDDSVVAKLSFDVPAQALTDVNQLTQSLAAMATQQEYISRSTGSWLEYMQQIPAIMAQASQSYRETITQLERMAYIQNEMGHGGGGIGAQGPSGPGQAQYSTAAAQGYSDPFRGMSAGMGVENPQGGQAAMGGMAGQDPRLFAADMGARGHAVNPALLGQIGGAAAGIMGQGGVGGSGGGLGYGNAAPGSMSSQATSSSRHSAQPPDPTQSGQGLDSEPQRVNAEPSDDAPAWQHTLANTLNGAGEAMAASGVAGGQRSSSLLGLAAKGMGAAGKWAQNNPGAMGGMGSKLGGIAKGAGLAGLAVGGFNLAQDAGEEYTKYNQLGQVQGGDAATGVGYEAQARIMALNPFITTQQARQAMQMALGGGFRGGDYDTITDYMLSNFKNLGTQMATTFSMTKEGIISGQSATDSSMSTSALLTSMHALSKDGGASAPVREEQGKTMMEAMVSHGISQPDAQRAITGFQQGYGDKQALKDTIGDVATQASGSDQFQQLAANKLGISGYLPGVIGAGLGEHGIDQAHAFEAGIKQVAGMVSGSRLNQISQFMSIMGSMGISLDIPEATALLDKANGSVTPTQTASASVTAMGQAAQAKLSGQDVGPAKGFLSRAGDVFKDLTGEDGRNIGDVWNSLRGRGDSENDDKKLIAEANNFNKGGRDSSEPPKTAQPSAPIQTQGSVNGEVRITVDQQGRVSAPQSIQLTGTQTNAFAGAGSSQVNNPPVGDNHSSRALGG